jgi:glutaredoxin
MQRAVLTKPSALLATTLLMLAASAPAWALYKVVGPDGRITYTDRAPGDRPAQALKSNGSAASTEGLPFELQRIVARYPVIVYTGDSCPSCDAGRQMLKARGIPFAEKTVKTSDDAKAFAKLEGTDQLPVVRIGQKQLVGFSQQDWASYLDAAGYPAKSALPLNYQQAAPVPLAPPKAVEPTQGKGERNTPALPPAGDNNTAPGGSAPSGFRF